MYEILSKQKLNPSTVQMEILAPLVAKKARVGQFIILRSFENSKRIPFTMMDWDSQRGTISIIYQVLGAGTMELDSLKVGDAVHDFLGPLGTPSELEDLKKVCVVGGGLGCAIAYPAAKELHRLGAEVQSIIGFRSKDLVILENEFRTCSDTLDIMTDDGSYGEKGFVTQALGAKLKDGENYDRILAIGPLQMMKAVCAVSRPYGVKTIVSMNTIMVDGTGMCGGCRLTVGGEMRFACVDGPEFDGHLVDFDEAIARSGMYKDFEEHAREEACHLYHLEVK